jgi:predicted dehydrogenase
MKAKITRRRMLQAAGLAGAAIGFPTIVPSAVFGRGAPSNRVALAMIGLGRQGILTNLRTLVEMDDVRIVAVCDVDRWRLDDAKGRVDAKYGDKGCAAYADWREVLARDDVDAIMNSTPDFWHVPISLAAVRRGKHVSCEKPLTLSVAEGRVLADAAKKHGVVFRTDSECRSHAYMHKTAELVRNGYLGRMKRIECGVPRGDKPGGSAAQTPAPKELDYEMWMGPIERKPYMVDAVHPPRSLGRPGWMRCRDTCEGMITNWGTHVLDVAQQVNNTERTGPVSVEGTGTYPPPDSGIWNVLIDFKVQFQYANGLKMDYVIDPEGAYLRVEGEDGWIQANWNRKGGLQASDKNILTTKLKPTDLTLPQRGDKEDFIYCIRKSAPQESMIDAEVGHRTCSLGQLAHIAINRGRKLQWQPEKEVFTDDEDANRMLTRRYRKPWGL